jgi:hypothetical protein
MIACTIFLLITVLIRAQMLDFCNVRCDVDLQCGGECNQCRTTAANDRLCLGPSACGEQCRSDIQCGKACKSCIDGVCGGLPCGSDCERSSWCHEDCGACLASPGNSSRLVCTQPCGTKCSSSADCAAPCSDCGKDGVCGGRPALSVGAVVGITIAVAILCGGVAIPLIVACLLRAATVDDDADGDDDPQFLVFFYCLWACPIGIVVIGLVIGLSLGLSPSICCS